MKAHSSSTRPFTVANSSFLFIVASCGLILLASGVVASTPVAAANAAHAATGLPTTPASKLSGSSSDCGGSPALDIRGTELTCTFDDEFNGTSLDTKKWVVQQTATSGYTNPGATKVCFVDSPNNVSVGHGHLNLTVRKEAAPFLCRIGRSGFSTSYTSGMVSTYGLFSQTYGSFEVRAKLPSSTIQGLQETFWLWPTDSTEYGASWPASGEIDFAEFYSRYPTLDIPYIHYNAAAPDPNVTAFDCTIAAGQFNTYGVEWSPTSITITYNGKTCLVDHPTPAVPLTGNEPFNKPFLISLTQTLGFGANTFLSGSTPLPSTTEVDWIRVWS